MYVKIITMIATTEPVVIKHIILDVEALILGQERSKSQSEKYLSLRAMIQLHVSYS